jgi:hypothetical protein
VRKSERKSSVCCLLLQQLSTQSCHSYHALLILKHSVWAVLVWIMHFAKIPTHIHTRPASHVTLQMETQIRGTVIKCRLDQAVVHMWGMITVGEMYVCMYVWERERAEREGERKNTLSGQPITGWPVWVKETRFLYRNILPSRFYFPANSIVVSFILLKPRLNNTTLIDFACILPSPLHGTNKQSKFIQNS